jgi:Kdo2-lipid IVA lauroyltransferase/acyltransferase
MSSMLTIYRFFKFIFRYLLPPAARYPLARGIARIVIRFNRRRRDVIVGNLTPIVGAQQARALAPELLGNFLMTAVDFFCTRRDIVRSTPIENVSYLEKAYRKTKRVVAVTAHLGYWELGLPCLMDKGFSITGVYAPYRDDDVVQWIMSHRSPDMEWIPTNRGAVEACIDAIRRGRVLGMAGDISFGEKGRRVKIAGTYTRLPLGPWAIAVRAEAAVVPGFVVRERPGGYRVILHEPIFPGEGSFRRKMERMQDIYRSHVEHYIKTYPTQWGVLQPFWEPVEPPQASLA